MPQAERIAVSAARPRAVRFAVVGGGVFLLGLGVLVALVSGLGLPPVPAGVIATTVSLQANFLLSRRITWADRSGDLRGQWVRFHSARAGTVVGNQALYSLLVVAGLPYLMAIVATTALATLLNFFVSDRYVFR